MSTPVQGSGKADPRVARTRRDAADGAVHRDVRGVSGTGPACCRGGHACSANGPTSRFVLAGGKPDQVARAQGAGRGDRRRRLDLHGRAAGRVIPSYLDAADVLVSPRSTGTNTPLKIYQYLRSGRVIVATRLLTHTQVLSDEVAILTEPTPTDSRAASFEPSTIRQSADDASAKRPRRLAETRYTYEAYLQRTREACAGAGRVMAVGRSSRRNEVDPITTATPRTPIRRWRRASTPGASAGRSDGCSSRIRSACSREFLGDVSGSRILDMATGTGRAALALAQAGRTRHRRRCLERDAGRRTTARRGARTGDRLRRRRRARADVSRPVVRRRRLPAHADARARTGARRCRSCAASAVISSCSTIRPSAASHHYRRSGVASHAAMGQQGRSVPGLQRRQHRTRARPPRVSHHLAPQAVRPSDRASQGDRLAWIHARHRRAGSRASGMLKLAGSPVTLAAERCAS